MTAAPPPVTGKKELCAWLKWSRPTLDRRLEGDQNFPIRKRGDRGGGWEFDLDAVGAYLEGGVLSRTAPAKPEAKATPRAPAKHAGEATARQRRELAQAELMEDKLRKQRGALVEAELMRMAVSDMLTHLGTALAGLPDAVVRRLNLPAAAATEIRDLVDQMRRDAVDEMRLLMSDDG
jgi:phage terminase Nu1 subunit (DNA packaging protein)